MTPADQILASTQELEGQITKLIREFEDRTGVCVSRVETVEFMKGSARQHGVDLNVRVHVELPPPTRTKESP